VRVHGIPVFVEVIIGSRSPTRRRHDVENVASAGANPAASTISTARIRAIILIGTDVSSFLLPMNGRK
jgi:hypothetical protein